MRMATWSGMVICQPASGVRSGGCRRSDSCQPRQGCRECCTAAAAPQVGVEDALPGLSDDGLIDRQSLAGGLVSGHAALGARRQQVVQADVGEGSAHRHLSE